MLQSFEVHTLFLEILGNDILCLEVHEREKSTL